jgi:S-adenosylmethionine uptake transporter
MLNSISKNLRQTMFYITKSNLITGLAFSFISSLISAYSAVFIDNRDNTAPILLLLFMQSVACLIFSLSLKVSRKEKINFNHSKKTMILYFLRAMVGLSIYGCYYLAIHFIGALASSLLLNLAPLFVPLILRIVCKVRTCWYIYLVIFIGFCGLYLLLYPIHLINNQEEIGYLIGVIAGILLALSLILVKSLSKTESVHDILLYYGLFGSIINGIILSITSSDINFDTMIICMFLSVLFVLRQFTMTYSLKLISAEASGIFNYFTIIFIVLYSVYFNSSMLDMMDTAGIILIILSCVLVIYLNSMGEK